MAHPNSSSSSSSGEGDTNLTTPSASQPRPSSTNASTVPNRPDLVIKAPPTPKISEYQHNPDPLVAVRESEGRGLGLYAICDIPAGSILLFEKPLLIVSAEITNAILDENDEYNFSAASSEIEALLDGQIAALSEDQKNVFYALCRYKRDERESLNRAILCNNGFDLCGDDATGIFEVACRINHACLPNSHYTWHPADPKRIVELQERLKDLEEDVKAWRENNAELLQKAEEYVTSAENSPDPLEVREFFQKAKEVFADEKKSQAQLETIEATAADLEAALAETGVEFGDNETLTGSKAEEPSDKLEEGGAEDLTTQGGGRMMVYNTFPLMAGEEITIDYGHNVHFLLKHYGFDCSCSGCIDLEPPDADSDSQFERNESDVVQGGNEEIIEDGIQSEMDEVV